VDHADKARENWLKYCENPGPIIVGAAQGASCFGPGYEHAFIMDTDLRKRGIRDKAPMTFVTSEPYVGHLGLGGVGNTRGMIEAAMRHRHIKWICNAKVDRVESKQIHITEHDEDGKPKKTHTLPFAYAMMMPPFRGIPALRGIEGLVNPRGFVIVDKHQRNPKYYNIFSVGVCIAIPPLEQTPVPVGVPKTGYMIESMVTATVHNIADEINGRVPHCEPTWNALCLADFGDRGMAFIAQPQNPPRNVSWSSEGRWVHWAKVLFERYFMRKVRRGTSEPFYERYGMMFLKLPRIKGKFKRPG
jgi:sulfide:quinone oxidoreductase